MLKFLKTHIKIRKMKKKIFSIYVLLITGFHVNSQELVIGEERIEPGIIFVFEGAIISHNAFIYAFKRKSN